MIHYLQNIQTLFKFMALCVLNFFKADQFGNVFLTMFIKHIPKDDILTNDSSPSLSLEFEW